jgi:hypothetical protein
MKKLMMVALMLVLVPMLFGINELTPISEMPKLLTPINSGNGDCDGCSRSRIVPVDKLQDVLEDIERGGRDEDSLYYSSLVSFGHCWNYGGNPFQGAIKLTQTELSPYIGWDVIAIVFRECQNCVLTDNEVIVYSGASAPTTILSSETFSHSTATFKRVDLSSPVPVPASGNLWPAVSFTGYGAACYPLTSDVGPYVDGKGAWIKLGASWYQLWQVSSPAVYENLVILAIVTQSMALDVGPVSIDMPSTVSPGTSLPPMATVKNFGSDTSSFDVTCEIEPDAYSSTEPVDDLAPGDSVQVTFSPDFAFMSGSYTVTVYTELMGDENTANDTLVHVIDVVFDDVSTVSIDIPSFVPPDTSFNPQSTVANLGTDTESFDVTCIIDPGAYSSTYSVVDLAPDETLQVTFPDAFVFAPDTYTVTVYTELGGDEDTSNDTLEMEVISTGIAEWDNKPTQFTFSAPTISRKGNVDVEIRLPEATKVDLSVYSAIGSLCETVISNRLSPGTHVLSNDIDLPTGVYFFNLKTGSGIDATKKVLVVK